MTKSWGPRDAEDFLRCGGTFTFDQWIALDETTRANLAEVARAIEADRIVALVAALKSDQAHLNISAIADGGVLRDRSVMGSALQAVGERLREVRRK